MSADRAGTDAEGVSDPVEANGEPLLPLILALVGGGSTSDDMAVRLAAAVVDASPDRCGVLLDRLAGLGLARVASAEGRPRRYVLTSLGQHTLAVSLARPSQAAARFEDLERLRTDLLATIAHELRTPLTAVRTCAGLLADPATDSAPEQRQQLVESIVRNADRMQRLVEDVLDLTRFRAGRVQLQLRRFDARVIGRDLAASMSPVAHERDLRLVLDLPDSPTWVYGDHRRLEQAVLNFLSNAQKFSPPGGVINLDVESEGSEVVWRVTDQGPGISAEDQERLFERFFVGRNDQGEPFAGTGLGLPTALAIAQAHGGRIEVRSAPHEGSSFALVVPAAGPAGVDES